MNVKGRTALVTGAASGIGRGIAHALARRGCHLALADVNETGLEETTSSAASGVRLRWHKLHRSGDMTAAAIPAQPGELRVLDDITS